MLNLETFNGKHCFVLGLGRAGLSSFHALHRAGAIVYVWDDNENSLLPLKSDETYQSCVCRVDDAPWDKMDYVVMSPGIPLTHPTPHPVVQKAKISGKCHLVCDIELLNLSQPQSRHIGITGTNGKSTTTSLMGHIIGTLGNAVQVGGNIGIPVCTLEKLDATGYYVTELSSYQLDLIEHAHFNVSIWLNISPDHLDRHGDMEGYVAAKSRLFKNHQKNDLIIISIDDDYSKKQYDKLVALHGVDRVFPVTIKEDIGRGISVIDDEVSFYHPEQGKESFTLPPREYLPGDHNAQNIAVCYAVSRLYCGYAHDKIMDAIYAFKGLRHRMQFVREINGIRYINDSKATNAEAASHALKSVDNIYWILGGIPKAGGIEELGALFAGVKHAYIIGQAKDDFAKTLDKHQIAHSLCANLESAIKQASDDAANTNESTKTVLLSPACASFDMWSNFEVRGDAFCDIVNQL